MRRSPQWKFYGTEAQSCTTQRRGTPLEDPAGSHRAFDLPPASGSGAMRLFLRLALDAAYTPFSIDGEGRLYAQNAGHLFVVGEGERDD